MKLLKSLAIAGATLLPMQAVSQSAIQEDRAKQCVIDSWKCRDEINEKEVTNRSMKDGVGMNLYAIMSIDYGMKHGLDYQYIYNTAYDILFKLHRGAYAVEDADSASDFVALLNPIVDINIDEIEPGFMTSKLEGDKLKLIQFGKIVGSIKLEKRDLEFLEMCDSTLNEASKKYKDHTPSRNYRKM